MRVHDTLECKSPRAECSMARMQVLYGKVKLAKVKHKQLSMRHANCTSGLAFCPCGVAHTSRQGARRVCCPHTCGACGGKKCELRPGGKASCCVGPIVQSGHRCMDSRDTACFETFNDSAKVRVARGVQKLSDSVSTLAADLPGLPTTAEAHRQPLREAWLSLTALMFQQHHLPLSDFGIGRSGSWSREVIPDRLMNKSFFGAEAPKLADE